MMTSRPRCSAGTNGSGGAGMTLAMVDSSSGAACASATKAAITAGVAGCTSRPPTNWRSSCSRNWNRVTTPKLRPPPRMAQNSSGCDWSSTWSNWPSAVTSSAASRLSMVRPVLADQVADPAAEGEPADPDRAGVAEPGRQAVRPGRGRVLPGGQARLRPGGALVGVDVQPPHPRQVQHDPALADAVAGQAVAATADGQLQA